MFNGDITYPHLLIFFPLVAGLLIFFIKEEKVAKAAALLAALITLVISVTSILNANDAVMSGNTFSYVWLPYIGSSFSVKLDATGRILTLLTAVSFPVIFLATYKASYKKANVFFGLMMLSECGLMGV